MGVGGRGNAVRGVNWWGGGSTGGGRGGRCRSMLLLSPMIHSITQQAEVVGFDYRRPPGSGDM